MFHVKQCWPGGTTPPEPPDALRAPRWYFADVLARGRPPEPPLRFAPARWYFADSTGRSPGPRARLAGPVTSASP